MEINRDEKSHDTVPLICVLLSKEQMNMAEKCLRPATQGSIMFKNNCAWAILEGLGGPLGSAANPSQTGPGRSIQYTVTWLSLQELHIRRYGTRVQACSKNIHFLHYLYHINYGTIFTFPSNFLIRQMKMKQHHELQ
jgi:hypothetical protein